MIDITMSDDYRAFLEELNYKFTDSQTATLVWNDPMKNRQQKLTALALLRDTTKDIVLKKQLTERIEYENKLSKEEADIVNPFRPERFEDAFFEIPFCYKSAGTPVKDIVDGTYGILSSGEDDWNNYLQEIKDRKWEVDYSDIQAVVLYPIKSEYWDHVIHCIFRWNCRHIWRTKRKMQLIGEPWKRLVIIVFTKESAILMKQPNGV